MNDAVGSPAILSRCSRIISLILAISSEPVTSVGTNTSYRIVALGAMALDKAYIQANNPECNQAPGSPFAGGNGSTGCIKGWLTQISGAGEVGPPPPPGGVIGSQFRVQLIK